MKPFVAVSLVIACACLLAACGDDDNPAAPDEEPQGHWEETTIGCWEYENNRFLRLDLPASWNHEVLGYTQADDPGRDPAAESIDLSTVRVYRNLGNVPAGPNDISYAAATIDPTGRWDADFLANVDQSDWLPAWTWRSLELSFVRDFDGSLIAVDLRRQMQGDDILAVAYQVVDAAGDALYTVGDHPDLGGQRGLDIEGQGYFRFKLLKPERRDPFTFQYVLRNIYSLGVANIDIENFAMRIESLEAGIDHPDQHGTKGLTYLRLFGLDRENPQGEPIPDGVVDIHRSPLFDPSYGLLRFPLEFPFPFDDVEETYRDYAMPGPVQWEWSGTELARSIEGGVAFYDWQTLPADYLLTGRFQFIVRRWVWDPCPSLPPADRVSLARPEWVPASLPQVDRVGREGRADDTRWFAPPARVLRRWLEPELEGPARDETVPTLEVAVNPGGEPWEWAGVMTGFVHPGLDFQAVDRLEFWVNDFAGALEDRHGILHVDLGAIDEDFQWRLVDGTLEDGTFQLEDRNLDGIFVLVDEDTGLDAVIDPSTNEVVQTGALYGADRGTDDDPYPDINNTAGNGREDTEDIDRDTRFDRDNLYLTWGIDLAGDAALADPARDHPDADLQGTAWRKFAVLLADGEEVGGFGAKSVAGFSHLRLWIENRDGTPARLQIAELRFR